jgi:glutathione synthase/RimK-type ligase-like ATP-grasp enzyme
LSIAQDKKRVLLTGGRAPATLDLARKFKHLGHEVYVAESIYFHLCRYSMAVKQCFTVPSPAKKRVAYIKALSDIIKKYNIDILIPMCEESFYIANDLEKLSSQTKVVIEKIDLLNELHNKFLFNKKIANTPISVPKTVLLNSLDEYHALLKNKKITYPHILKPVYSRFAAKAKCILSPQKVECDISAKKPWVAQEYIQGKLLCTYSVCHEGKILANSFYWNNYTAGKYGTGVSFEGFEHPGLLEWVTRFVRDINYTGQIAFDVILTDDGQLWPIECNPRATSGIHLFADYAALPDAFLSNAIAHPEIKMRSHPMLGLGTVVYGLSSVRSFTDFIKWLQCFWHGKDVVFRWRDPMPSLTQFFVVADFIRISRQHHISIMDAITYDIEWNGK